MNGAMMVRDVLSDGSLLIRPLIMLSKRHFMTGVACVVGSTENQFQTIVLCD